MKVVHWVFIFAFVKHLRSYENLSRRSGTVLTQSSTYENYNTARAHDGILLTTEEYCAITDTKSNIAWLQVDLWKLFSIKNVRIFYRKQENWHQYRFRQFYLDVSNSPATDTITSQRTRCYTDNTTAPNLPPNIIDIPCKQTARYVIVETTYDAPEDNPTTGAILEICEIEVYGCEEGQHGSECKTCQGCQKCDIESGWCACDSSQYGPDCSLNCSVYCKNGCSRDSGTCYSCIEGHYGDACDKKCGPGCVSGCNRYKGSCVCRPGWQGDRCDECSQLYYGTSCNYKCSQNCISGTCFAHNGSCDVGCKCSIVEDLQFRVQQLQNSMDSNNQSPVYIVSVFLLLSVVMNVVLIIRISRAKVVEQTGRATNKGVNGPSSTNDVLPNPVIYEKVDEDSSYQELGDLSSPSLYDGLDRT